MSLLRHPTWSFWGFVLAVPALIVAVWALRAREAEIGLKLVSRSDVVRLNSPPKGLRILLNEADILADGKSIQLARLRVANTGSKHLLQSEYDRELEWGVDFVGAEVIDITIDNASSTYLRDEFAKAAASHGSERIVFPKPIIEAGNWVELAVTFVLGPNQALALRPFGKVAGTDEMRVSTDSEPLLPSVGRLWIILLAYVGTGVAFLTVVFITWRFEAARYRRRNARIGAYVLAARHGSGVSDEERRLLGEYQGWSHLWLAARKAFKHGTVVDTRPVVLGAVILAICRFVPMSPGAVKSAINRLVDRALVPLPEDIFVRDGDRVSLQPWADAFMTKFLKTPTKS